MVNYDTTARSKYTWNYVYLSYIPRFGGLRGNLLKIPKDIGE